MPTISLDLRRRIIKAYDQKQGTREDIARRFDVSVGLVAKLLHQRRKTGDIAPRHHHSGRKPKLLSEHRRQLRALLSKQPDLTLRELQEKLGVDCTLPAIHYVLVDMGLTYKKRRSVPANKTARALRARGVRGAAARAVSIRKSCSFWMNPVPKPI
jgi:transposase